MLVAAAQPRAIRRRARLTASRSGREATRISIETLAPSLHRINRRETRLSFVAAISSETGTQRLNPRRRRSEEAMMTALLTDVVPPADIPRWSPRRKAEIVDAVRDGV